jgi:hypothetical protein
MKSHILLQVCQHPDISSGTRITCLKIIIYDMNFHSGVITDHNLPTRGLNSFLFYFMMLHQVLNLCGNECALLG